MFAGYKTLCYTLHGDWFLSLDAVWWLYSNGFNRFFLSPLGLTSIVRLQARAVCKISRRQLITACKRSMRLAMSKVLRLRRYFYLRGSAGRGSEKLKTLPFRRCAESCSWRHWGIVFIRIERDEVWVKNLPPSKGGKPRKQRMVPLKMTFKRIGDSKQTISFALNTLMERLIFGLDYSCRHFMREICTPYLFVL